MTARSEDSAETWHEALFYRDADALLTGTVPFVEEGLDGGEAVAVAMPGRNLRLLEKALGPVARAVRFVDMTEAGRNPGRIIPGVIADFADRHGGPARFIGEPIWAARSADEYPACAVHEALINEAFAGRGLRVLCPYAVRELSRDVLAEAEATHPVLVRDGGRRPSARYRPDAVVRAHNVPLPAPPGAETVEFDMRGLTAARRFAATRAVELGLPAERRDDVALVAGELCGNSVQHGGGSGVLRIWSASGHVVCQVEDGGRITDPLAGRKQPPPTQPGGRGLLLVNHLADLVRIHTDSAGTAIRAHFRLP
ncbi:anti-sigma regulatory factor (Ser/Thr protein kinase) [Prauserella shujinwangii]|uniref:Anti-sigma regulatory factor (Ser/Thr protein kinase) n=1 Tax=Prauserella shujinwangii TaxID=1453103 RepID=A0A2T0LU77_9PSEU|nr:anti-sigma factor RsbA family regulatory protein [Prauserella shujinwangii]PRX47292.1 anti-sigma regulatory factor (Ser/Thr protein kinase) [Prauserella shujinwangii]